MSRNKIKARYFSDTNELEILFESNFHAKHDFVTDNLTLYRTEDDQVVGLCVDKFNGFIEQVPPPANEFCFPTADDEWGRAELLYGKPAVARPSWDDYFMGLAFMASRRSPDLSTKHGCVLVDVRNHHVVGTGYNGFEKGLNDEAMARIVPKDYASIRHSERNAVDNCRQNLLYMDNIVAYVTGQCCLDCTQYLIDHNVKTIVMANRRGFSKWTGEDDKKFDLLVREHGVIIRRITPNLNWMVESTFIKELTDLGFLS